MAKRGFLIEGYQAGVLGGVQETKPFLDEMGVDKKPHVLVQMRTVNGSMAVLRLINCSEWLFSLYVMPVH